MRGRRVRQRAVDAVDERAVDDEADRAEGVLRIRRFTPEPRVRGDVDGKLERAAARLARVLGLERVER